MALHSTIYGVLFLNVSQLKGVTVAEVPCRCEPLRVVVYKCVLETDKPFAMSTKGA